MEYKNIYDMHTHSENSFDGNDSCILLCEAAKKAGAQGIAITDHLDIDGEGLEIRGTVTNQYMQCEIARDVFKDEVEVFRGVELGQGIYRQKEADEVLQSFHYDFVLGSMHNLENRKDFYFIDYTREDVGALLREYFEAVLLLAQWNRADSIAHLTYPLRYIIGKYGMRPDLSAYDEIIDAIFETIIKNHKALELNVSSLFNYHYETMPGAAYIKRYHDLGGKYITVGTDAHIHEKVAVGIDRGYDILKACGFSHVTVFRQREPQLIDIR